MTEVLGCFSCRYRSLGTLAYGFARHEHYRHHSRCEHGLSSDRLAGPRLPENHSVLPFKIDAFFLSLLVFQLVLLVFLQPLLLLLLYLWQHNWRY